MKGWGSSGSISSVGSIGNKKRRKLPALLHVCIVLILAVTLSCERNGRAEAQVITSNYAVPFYALQDLPLPPSLAPTATRFGCGAVVSADGSTVVALGMDTASLRQFALIYEGSPSAGYVLGQNPFFGDTISIASGFLQATNDSYGQGTSCPVCISSDGGMFAMGGWMTSLTAQQSTNNSIIIAKRSGTTPGSNYQFLARLYSGVIIATGRFFANDMVCTGGFEHIKIAEPAHNNVSMAALTMYTVVNASATPLTWEVSNTAAYSFTENQQRTLRMAISGDEVFYAVKQMNSTVELRWVTNDTIEQTVDLINTTGGADMLGLALDYHARILTFAVQGPTFPGEMYLYSTEKSAGSGIFDTTTVLALTDPSNTSYSSWGTGMSMAFMPNETVNALMVGMPGFPIKPTSSLFYPQTGAISTWLPCTVTNIASVNFTEWIPGQAFLKPFSTGIALADGLGASTTSHSAWSRDGEVLVVSAPMGTYSPATGRVFLFTNAFSLCPVAPVAVPVIPPTPIPPTAADPILIAAIVFMSLVVLAVAIAGLCVCANQ